MVIFSSVFVKKNEQLYSTHLSFFFTVGQKTTYSKLQFSRQLVPEPNRNMEFSLISFPISNSGHDNYFSSLTARSGYSKS